MEKALYLATDGRRGPVWIDVPLNIQGADIDVSALSHYVVPEKQYNLAGITEKVIAKLKGAKVPLLLAGAAIRRAEAYDVFRSVMKKLSIPVVSPTCVADLLPLSEPLYYQNFGVVGGRTGNFLVQNADVILSVGCRLSLNQIGFNFKAFAPQAYKNLNTPGYVMCEIIEDSSQGPEFKTTSKKLPNGEMISAPLDELAPPFSEDEFVKYRYFCV